MARISVIIPCYNHARFLGEAIQSALAQTHPSQEVIVIDDGSKDDPAAVVAKYPTVRLIQQKNQGRSAACNAGLAAATGDYLVFLDADDRLLPCAIELGLKHLAESPDCAFAAGQCRMIASDGSPLPSLNRPFIDHDHYRFLLTGRNFVANPGAVIYRAGYLKEIRGYDVSLNHCEDYDVYLRICRRFPVCIYRDEVVEYRLHGANKSRDAIGMFKTNRRLLLAQIQHTRKDPELRRVLRQGFAANRQAYGYRALRQLFFSDRDWDALKLQVGRVMPRALGEFARSGEEKSAREPISGGAT